MVLQTRNSLSYKKLFRTTLTYSEYRFRQDHQLDYYPSRFILCRMQLLFVFAYEITPKNNANFFQALWRISSNAEWSIPNPTSPWSSAPLLVHKPGPVPFRFTVKLRPINRFTIKHQFPMPILDQDLSKASKSKHFFNVDFVVNYWQLLPGKSLQISQSFVTLDGSFTPNRVLHGSTNAVHHPQSSLGALLPTELKQVLLHWLDDILGHGKTVDELLSQLCQFFSICLEMNLRLHPTICFFY